MADMPTDFWAGWIVALVIVSVLGLCWLVFSIYFSSNQQEQADSPIWDETLSEGHNPAPMWWFWMTLTALVISVVYLILYPGLGSFSGTLKWSQHGRLDHSLARYNNKFSPIRKNILKRSVSELQSNDAIMKSAQRIFVQNCAACHGMEGKGQALAFPNLQDNDWQWGDSEEAIVQTIKQGRQAAMIGWLDIIGEEGVVNVKNYVKTLASKTNFSGITEGKKIFQANCAACHGLLGEGNQALGAPNLADDVWLYGSSDDALHQTIAMGRRGVMPAFDDRLDEMQIRIVAAWLMNNDKYKLVTASETKEPEIINPKVVKDIQDYSNPERVKISEAELGKNVYEKYCSSCHQANGQGLPGVFPPLKDSKVVLNDDADEHIDIILNGLAGKMIEGVSYSSPMPGFASQLSDEEVVAVANHERSHWGNNAIQVTRDSMPDAR